MAFVKYNWGLMNGFKGQPMSKHELETIEILVSTGRYFKRLQYDIYLL